MVQVPSRDAEAKISFSASGWPYRDNAPSSPKVSTLPQSHVVASSRLQKKVKKKEYKSWKDAERIARGRLLSQSPSLLM
jgi:hypothetical protein